MVMAENEGGESKFLTGFLLGFLVGVLIALGVGGSLLFFRGRQEMVRAGEAMREAEMARAIADEARAERARAEKAKLDAERARRDKRAPEEDDDDKLPAPDVEVDR
jgi:hypothetical protein